MYWYCKIRLVRKWVQYRPRVDHLDREAGHLLLPHLSGKRGCHRLSLIGYSSADGTKDDILIIFHYYFVFCRLLCECGQTRVFKDFDVFLNRGDLFILWFRSLYEACFPSLSSLGGHPLLSGSTIVFLALLPSRWLNDVRELLHVLIKRVQFLVWPITQLDAWDVQLVLITERVWVSHYCFRVLSVLCDRLLMSFLLHIPGTLPLKLPDEVIEWFVIDRNLIWAHLWLLRSFILHDLHVLNQLADLFNQIYSLGVLLLLLRNFVGFGLTISSLLIFFCVFAANIG